MPINHSVTAAVDGNGGWFNRFIGGGDSAGQEACTLSGVMNRVSRAPTTASSAGKTRLAFGPRASDIFLISSTGKTQLAFGHRTSGIFLISAYASLLAWLFHSYAVRSLVQSIGHLFHRFLLKG